MLAFSIIHKFVADKNVCVILSTFLSCYFQINSTFAMIADFQKDASNLASGATSLENITSGDNDLAVLTDLFTFNIQLDSFNFCILVPLQLRNIAPVAQSVECPLRGNRMSRVWSRATTYQSL